MTTVMDVRPKQTPDKYSYLYILIKLDSGSSWSWDDKQKNQ